MATYWENSCSFGLRYVSWYKYLIVSLVFSHLGFWSGNLFLIAPFPDLCLLVPFSFIYTHRNKLGNTFSPWGKFEKNPFFFFFYGDTEFFITYIVYFILWSSYRTIYGNSQHFVFMLRRIQYATCKKLHFY